MKAVLLQRFNAMVDRILQDSYLAGGICANIVQRYKQSTLDSAKLRAYPYSYTRTTGSETTVVCREAATNFELERRTPNNELRRLTGSSRVMHTLRHRCLTFQSEKSLL